MSLINYFKKFSFIVEKRNSYMMIGLMEGFFKRKSCSIWITMENIQEEEDLCFPFSSSLSKCNNLEDTRKDCVGFVYLCVRKIVGLLFWPCLVWKKREILIRCKMYFPKEKWKRILISGYFAGRRKGKLTVPWDS